MKKRLFAAALALALLLSGCQGKSGETSSASGSASAAGSASAPGAEDPDTPPQDPPEEPHAFDPKRDVREENGVLEFQVNSGKVTVEDIGEGEGGHGAVITVWDPDDPGAPLQTFTSEVTYGGISPYDVNVVDANFDGYDDFGWKYFQGTSNTWYHYWIWRPDEGRFVEEPAFPQTAAGSSSDGICGPMFDEENRAVIGWRRENATDGEYTVHQWVDGALTLRRRIQLTQDWDTWVWTLRVFEVEDGAETELYHYEGSDNNGSDGSFAYDEAGRWTDLSYHGET